MSGWLQVALEVNSTMGTTGYAVDTIGRILQSVSGDQAVSLAILAGTNGGPTYLPSPSEASSTDVNYAITDWLAVLQNPTGQTDPAVIIVTYYYADGTSGEVDRVKFKGETVVIGALGLGDASEPTTRRLKKIGLSGGSGTYTVSGRAFCMRSA